jgi:CRISPR-associated endonuclease/helicase Cas3
LTLALAAAAHDHGKADPRTQAFFHGGIRPLGAEPIAKSIFGTDDPRTERMARAIAGLPTALRHEIASVAILAKWLTNGAGPEDGIDRDLVLHLVGTHHGQGRPIPRIPTGGDDALAFHVDAADISGTAFGDGQDGWADGEWLQRFWRVIDRYGPWGTSYLEALLVLADRTVSARGG